MKMKKWQIGLAVFAAILVIGIGFFSLTGKSVAEVGAAKEFNVRAFQYGYEPDVISVNKGDRVKIAINNADVTHGIRIPDLDVRANDVIEFTANKQGEFTWYCNTLCGSGHGSMTGKLIVE